MTTTAETIMMKDDGYPGLYRCADVASIKAQRVYLCFQQVYLGSLVMGSAVSAFTTLGIAGVNTWLYTSIAIILTVGLLILWAMGARQDDKVWFDGRAIAESVKTATWRFMMKVPPFHKDDNVEILFIAELQEIREARPHLGKHLAGVMEASGSAITSFMRQVRSASIEKQRTFFIENRVRDQKSWYSRKAKMNVGSGARWFWATGGLQLVVVTIAIVQAAAGGLRLNVVPVITTCAAAFAAWSQMKRHDELAQAYALAAQELEGLESIASNQKSDDDFSQLVEQAENSISREHTMWCARRDVRLSERTGGSAGQRNT